MDEHSGPPPQQLGGWEGPQDDGRNYQYPVEDDGPPQISADLSDIARYAQYTHSHC